MTIMRRTFLGAAIAAAALSTGAWAQPGATATSTYTPSVGQSGKDVVWVPTSQSLVDRMLDMVKLTPQDRLVDLGSGDGRLVITAAKRGATARGIEFNPDMVALSKRFAQAEGVANRATFEKADIFQSDFSNATVVTLFLLPDLNLRLRPKLLDMKPGTRVVSNTFDMGDWEPDESLQGADNCAGHCTAYKWIVPAKVAGTWKLADREFALTQTYQKVQGTMREEGRTVPVTGRLDGTRIVLSAGNENYTGEVNGKAMEGTTEGGKRWSATLVSR
ncbi:class I SAM-dependent methyltransferase [Cupriavidus respiraculi]|uniref:Methyltransferase domain-containing protein n=1 Tax=Cupriavidus respiraculi TaxID=195930 RepID=A0ABN7YCG1_9BURK|nr:class I SAM-dependent methyltransferase [Cupriavidus respiraculi]MBY4945033.1 class I SAM-dependent methyltransferase [Cupriavidus respiraculi]CAG9171169.1 hypothetical protein LMG21510_01567 [Cupriavidus respiraculi]